MRLPSPSLRPSSTASASRVRTVGPATRRSITTSMSCRIWRSSDRSSVSCTTRPSTRARTKPCFSRSSNRSWNSPFCRRTIGASTANFVFAGSASMRPMICSRLWAVIGRAALRAVALADAGVQHAQEVVDLGDRADGRARVVAATTSARSRSTGDRPLMWSTSGLGICPRNCRAKRATGFRRTAAAPRRRACRTPASSCRCRETPVRQMS